MDLSVFEAKALAMALTDAGHSISERTAQRWKKGETQPKPQDIRAIRELLGLPDTTKEPPPEWAEAQTKQLLSAIERNRQTILEATGARFAELAELLLGEDNDDEAQPRSPGPQPGRPGPRKAP